MTIKNSQQTAAQLFIRSLVQRFLRLQRQRNIRQRKSSSTWRGPWPDFVPAYAQGIGVAGFHLHFLRQDKQAGGHALDYRLRAGKVQICTVHDLRVQLPTSGEFLKTNFEDRALSDKIKAAEG
jgi:acetolactate decarboxylase